MKTIVPPFSKARVLVAGDVMLDRYWTGRATRISPEAPVPVVHVQATEDRLGGAANVALNILTLGGQVDLLGVVGADEAGQALDALLRQTGIGCHLHAAAGAATSTKLRILSHHQQLVRADFEGGLAQADTAGLLADYERLAGSADVIVLSDYGKGTLQAPRTLIARAVALGKRVIVDPKGRDFSTVSRRHPDHTEPRGVRGGGRALRERRATGGAGRALAPGTGLTGLLITRGEQGMTLLWDGQRAAAPAGAGA